MCNCGQEEACGKNSQTEGGGGKGGHPECHVWEACHSGQEEPPSCDSHPCVGHPCDGHPCVCSVLGHVCPRCTARCTCPYVYFLFLLTINSPDRVYCVYISCCRNP